MFDWARPGQDHVQQVKLQKGARASQKEKTVKWITLLKWRLEEKTNQNLI